MFQKLKSVTVLRVWKQFKIMKRIRKMSKNIWKEWSKRMQNKGKKQR